MLSLTKLFQGLALPRLHLAKSLGSLYLVLGFLLALCIPQLASAQTQITNTASISVPAGVSNTAAGCASGTCTVADIDTVTTSLPLVSKTFTPATINAGGTSLLVITFTNTHKLVSASFSAPFTDVYPTGMLNAATPAVATTCSGAAAVATAGGTQISSPAATVVAPGASCSISAVVTSVTSPLAANTIPAGSLSTSVGANPSLITATLTVNASADLAITKTVSTSSVNAGGTFTYTIVIGNKGPSDVVNATWTDTLPTGLGTITNIVPSAGITGSAAGNVISGTTTLLNGQLATLTFQVSAANNASGVLTNSASVSVPAGTTDTVAANNFSTVTVTVTPVADLVITKTASTGTPNAGGTFSYTIVIGNQGPSDVTNATWTDTLPAGLGTITNVVTSSGVSAAAVGSTISGTSTLANGQVATVTFQVSVAPTASGVLTNTATVTVPAGTTELVPGNNSSAFPVTIGQLAALSVTKTNAVTSLVAGNTTSYTVTFANAGPSAAGGALITDAASAGLACTSVTCAATTGGASCPSSMPTLGAQVLAGATNFFGAGETIGTFPANSSVSLVVVCGVTATGQ
ncbi:MAG: DUF11 domain-containing protein [Burkholderiaceae bacterium]